MMIFNTEGIHANLLSYPSQPSRQHLTLKSRSQRSPLHSTIIIIIQVNETHILPSVFINFCLRSWPEIMRKNNQYIFLFPRPSLVFRSNLTILCILIAVPAAYCNEDEQYAACNHPFKCGPQLQEIWYPFWSSNSRPQYCGREGFELKCRENNPTIEIEAHNFRVLNINSDQQIMTIVRDDILGNFCQGIFQEKETFINNGLFRYNHTSVRNLSLYYDCSGGFLSEGQNSFNCTIDRGQLQITGFYTIDGGNQQLQNLTNTCNGVVKVPFLDSAASYDLLWTGNLTAVLRAGFEVRYQADNGLCRGCLYSGGICGYNESSNEFACFCRDRPRNDSCPAPAPAPAPASASASASGDSPNVKAKLGIGFGAAIGGMVIMAAIFWIYLRRKKNKFHRLSCFSRKASPDHASMVDFEKGDNLLGVHVFTYKELEKATNYFDSAKELGDGGFGTVYYGKLLDGRAVAVKRLYENNYKRVEQFMNEVEILARMRHQNLVSLYGCTSRHSRELLLVYEYIPNGTVADHLHGECAKPGALPWPIRLKIAIDTASALSYLHASDVIHRDVKTNNILLDNNFCVKVADFGLSRLFPTHVTHISTAPQGTPGYVDPEYHQCYQLTDKSDVFSFGVVLIELISSMPAVDITRHRHEINLSNLAITKIQNKALHELVDKSLGYESDYKVRKMIDAVAELAFQCLQSEKDMRPTMADVLEALKYIHSDGYNKDNAEEILKKSPDSVTNNWPSTETTPNSSN